MSSLRVKQFQNNYKVDDEGGYTNESKRDFYR